MPRVKPPDGETKEERFKRMAELRVTAALEKVRLIENLSNKSTYNYSDEDIEKIFKRLEDRLFETKMKFIRRKREVFKL